MKLLSYTTIACALFFCGCIKPVEDTEPVFPGDTRPTLYIPNVRAFYPGADTSSLSVSIYRDTADGKPVDLVQTFNMGANFMAGVHLDMGRTYYFDIHSENSYWHNWTNNPVAITGHAFKKHTDTLPLKLVHNYNYNIASVSTKGWSCIGAIDSAGRDISKKVSLYALYRVVKINKNFTGTYEYKDKAGKIQSFPIYLRTDDDGVSLFKDKNFTQFVNKIKPVYINGYAGYHNRMVLEPELDDQEGAVFMPHLVN